MLRIGRMAGLARTFSHHRSYQIDTSIKMTVESRFMSQDRVRIDRFLPLKPFVLDVLLELADEKRHGWSLIRAIQQRDGGDKILPANFYRTLRALKDDGLIAEADGDS